MAISLPVLQTNFEKIQAIPQGSFGRGLEALGNTAKTVTEYGEWNKADKKKKELEAILNASKTDSDKLAELMQLSKDLQVELEQAKQLESSNTLEFEKPLLRESTVANPDLQMTLGNMKSQYAGNYPGEQQAAQMQGYQPINMNKPTLPRLR